MVALIRGLLARRHIRRGISRRVRACFDGVDLTAHRFVSGGFVMKTGSGSETFYDANEIDRAIERLNKLMRDLQA